MDNRHQSILYTLLLLILSDYKKATALWMARNTMAQDYPMKVLGLEQMTVNKYRLSRVTEGVFFDSYNYQTGEMKAPKGFSFIEPKWNPDIAEKLKEVQESRRIFNSITNDALTHMLTVFKHADIMRTVLRGSFPNENIAKRLDEFITQKPIIEKALNEKQIFLSIESKKLSKEEKKEIDEKYRQIMSTFREIVISFVSEQYRKCYYQQDGWLYLDIFDSAYVEAFEIKPHEIDKELDENYKGWGLPIRKHKFANYIPEKIEKVPMQPVSVKPKTVTKSTPTKVKTTTVSKAKVDVKPTPTKVDVNPTPTKVVEKPVVNKTITKQEPVLSNEPVNVLDISKKTKVGKYYKIEKVDDVAKKIIIDDTVSEVSRLAFQSCYQLEEITLGKNLKVLEFGMFNNLYNLKKVNFVEGLTTIKNNVFDNSGLIGYHKLPKSLESIGNYAFNVRLPNDLQLSISKDTKLDEKSIHRLIKLELYGSSKPKTSKTTTEVKTTVKEKVQTPITISPEVEENYKKGEQIFYKYSGKKKMLEAATLMEPKAVAGDLIACQMVLQAYCHAEKYQKADQFIKPLIENKKVDMVYWFADRLYYVKNYADRSKELFLIAAENGMADAYARVAAFYYGNTEGFTKDYKKVMEYCLKGASLNSKECLRNLADIYRSGLSGYIKPNKAEYLKYVQRAAEAEDSFSQWWLACDYYKGRNGLPVDKKMANYWFERAANNPIDPVYSAKQVLAGDYSKIQ